ncbi:MAG: hypothetical protein LBE78_04730, partial [Burkholderiaceae bacterium]|nr:hypothetical protein [Burkholderiaceae bacterium]
MQLPASGANRTRLAQIRRMQNGYLLALAFDSSFFAQVPTDNARFVQTRTPRMSTILQSLPAGHKVGIAFSGGLDT